MSFTPELSLVFLARMFDWIRIWWWARTVRFGNPEQRAKATWRLAELQSRRAIPPLLQFLQSAACNHRIQAASLLGQIGDRQAIAPLVKLLSDPFWRIRETALKSLHKLGWKPTTPGERAIASVLKSRFKEAAREGLCAVEPLLDVFYHWPKDDKYKEEAQEALRLIDHPKRFHVYVRALESPKINDTESIEYHSVGMWVSTLLGETRNPNASKLLIEKLGTGSKYLRAGAAKALGGMRCQEAVGPLLDLLLYVDNSVNLNHRA